MSYVTCIGCNQNCDLETTNREIFFENYEDNTYESCCYCPCGGSFVEVEEEDLKKAWEEDNE